MWKVMKKKNVMRVSFKRKNGKSILFLKRITYSQIATKHTYLWTPCFTGCFQINEFFNLLFVTEERTMTLIGLFISYIKTPSHDYSFVENYLQTWDVEDDVRLFVCASALRCSGEEQQEDAVICDCSIRLKKEYYRTIYVTYDERSNDV